MIVIGEVGRLSHASKIEREGTHLKIVSSQREVVSPNASRLSPLGCTSKHHVFRVRKHNLPQSYSCIQLLGDLQIRDFKLFERAVVPHRKNGFLGAVILIEGIV